MIGLIDIGMLLLVALCIITLARQLAGCLAERLTGAPDWLLVALVRAGFDAAPVDRDWSRRLGLLLDDYPARATDIDGVIALGFRRVYVQSWPHGYGRRCVGETGPIRRHVPDATTRVRLLRAVERAGGGHQHDARANPGARETRRSFP